MNGGGRANFADSFVVIGAERSSRTGKYAPVRRPLGFALSIEIILVLICCLLFSCGGGGGGGGGEAAPAAPAPAPVAPPAPVYRIAGDSHGNGMAVSGALDAVYGVPWENDAEAGISTDILVTDWPAIIDGAAKVVVFIGTNDCKVGNTVGILATPDGLDIFKARVIWMIEQAHAQGVKLLWCNIPPNAGYMGDPTRRGDAETIHAVNAWLESLHYDNVALINFNLYARDPLDHDRFNPALSGDGVHVDSGKYDGLAQWIYDHDPWRV